MSGLRGYVLTAVLLAVLAAGAAGRAEDAGMRFGLDECVRLGLERNPDLGAAMERIRIAAAEMEIAASAYSPVVAVGETYAVTSNPSQAFMMILNQRQLSFSADFNNPETTDNFHTWLGVDWRVYDGGRRSDSRRAAEAGEALSIARADVVRNELVYQIHRGFFAVLRAGEFVRIQEAALGSLNSSLRAARQRLEAGTAVKTDVLNLEVRLAEMREQLARARNREALSRSALANLVDEPELRQAELQAPSPAAEPAEVDGLGFSGRPELRAAAAEIHRQEAEAERARGALRPSVDLTASYTLDTERWNDIEDSWFAGVLAKWEVFDGSRRRAEIRRAEAELARARQTARRIDLDAEHQLQEAVLAYLEAEERLAVTGKSVESAEESLRVTRHRYENGAAEITELLAAEAAVTSARALAASALYDREAARAGLKRVTGEFAAADGLAVGVSGRAE